MLRGLVVVLAALPLVASPAELGTRTSRHGAASWFSRVKERRQARRGPVMSEEAVQQRMSEIYDPDTLKQHFHTEPDERIRQKDVPERLQLIFEKREPAAPNEFPKEAQWMYPLLFSTAAEEEAEPAQVELL